MREKKKKKKTAAQSRKASRWKREKRKVRA